MQERTLHQAAVPSGVAADLTALFVERGHEDTRADGLRCKQCTHLKGG